MRYTSPKVLIVDDQPDILEFLQVLLEQEGYAVIIQDHTDRYIERLPDNTLPDLILLDVFLSGQDGREITKRLKSQEETRHIPVIMFSAHPHAQETALAAGADDFVEKPFDLNIVLAKIARLLSPGA